MKRVDLHVHAKVSKSFSFDLDAAQRLIEYAAMIGLDGLAMVEHLHGIDFWGIHTEMRRAFQYADGVYHTTNGFSVLTGAELSLHEGADLVLLGTIDQIVRFDLHLPHQATGGYKPVFDEAMEAIRHAHLLVIGAHMFRHGKDLIKLGKRWLATLDTLEANGKDFHQDARVHAAAKQIGLPVVGGSDAHYWPQVGIKSTCLPLDTITQASVAEVVRRGDVRVASLGYGPWAVQFCTAYKRARKAAAGYATPPFVEETLAASRS